MKDKSILIISALLVLWIILGGTMLIQDYMVQESERAAVQRELEKDLASRSNRPME